MLSSFSCSQLFTTLWTIACQPLLSMEFSRHEYWNGLPCPPPGTHPKCLMLSLYLSVLKIMISPDHSPKVTPNFLYHYDLMHLNIFDVSIKLHLFLLMLNLSHL